MVFTKYGHSSALSIKYGFSLRNFIFVLLNIELFFADVNTQNTFELLQNPAPTIQSHLRERILPRYGNMSKIPYQRKK